MNKKIIKLEILGAVLATILGSALHFTYALSGYHKLVAIFAAVNESTWEHLKLGFWPLFFWAVLEYFIFGKKVKNFFLAKLATLFLFCISVPIFFYTYSGILGTNFLPADISIFIFSIVLGQFAGFKIMNIKKDLGVEKESLILIFLIMLMFLLFTFFAPRNFLFKDPISKTFGITKW